MGMKEPQNLAEAQQAFAALVREDVVTISAEELLPPGSKLPPGFSTGRFNPRATEPCAACGGTGRQR